MRLNLSIPVLGGILCASVVAVGSLGLRAQQVSRIEANSFKVQLETYTPPFQTQIKTLLEGQNADPKPGGIILLTSPSLSRFGTNGLLEIQVRSPECTYNVRQRTISSTNVLQVEMSDGRFFTEGKGFLWTTNETIILSNQVRTIIRTPARKLHKP